MSKKQQKPKSNFPMMIIGGVLLAAMIVGWYLLTRPQSPVASNTNQANSAPAAKKNSTIPANAPKGAQPPTQAGSPTAAVVLEEFADFQCGSCAAANPTMNEIKSIYGSKINFIFRNYPLSMHEKAYDAAVAAEAAGMQGKFWDMQNLLFTNQAAWVRSDTHKQAFKEYAQRIGLDIAKYESDILGFAARARVEEDLKRGRAIGVDATPSLYINGNLVTFNDMRNIQTMRALIDAELAKANQPADAQ
jgi:protein-disulfide isomerase